MRKGQEEGPIELLLAVTLMTFVIIIGFYTYQNLSGSVSEQKLKDSLSSFARSLELVYQGGQGTSKLVQVDFSSMGGSPTIESIRLTQGTQSVCMKNLGKEDCLQLIAVTKSQTGKSTPFLVEMLNIPPTVTISFVNAPVSCAEKELNKIASDLWDDPTFADCGWLAKSYSFTITKNDANSIEIEQLGG